MKKAQFVVDSEFFCPCKFTCTTANSEDIKDTFYLYAFAICLLKVDHQQETALPPVGRHCFTTPENTKHPSQSWQQHFSATKLANVLI